MSIVQEIENLLKSENAEEQNFINADLYDDSLIKELLKPKGYGLLTIEDMDRFRFALDRRI
jgi:hypothetical protein